MRIDNQVTNGPRLVVDDKILDVADVSVLGVDVTTRHRLRAAEMRILVSLTTRCFRPSITPARRVRTQPPCIRAAPVPWPAVIRVIIPVILPRDRSVGRESRAFLDLSFGQVDRYDLATFVSGVQRVR